MVIATVTASMAAQRARVEEKQIAASIQQETSVAKSVTMYQRKMVQSVER